MSARIEQETTEDGHQLQQYITFAVAESEYGVSITTVREIKAWTQTTNLPNAPEHMRGVINLRGAIVPIYDLRALFGHGYTEATQKHVVIIMLVQDRIICKERDLI